MEKSMKKSFLASEFPQSVYIMLIVECACSISMCHMEAFSIIMFSIMSNWHGTGKSAKWRLHLWQPFSGRHQMSLRMWMLSRQKHSLQTFLCFILWLKYVHEVIDIRIVICAIWTALTCNHVPLNNLFLKIYNLLYNKATKKLNSVVSLYEAWIKRDFLSFKLDFSHQLVRDCYLERPQTGGRPRSVVTNTASCLDHTNHWPVAGVGKDYTCVVCSACHKRYNAGVSYADNPNKVSKTTMTSKKCKAYLCCNNHRDCFKVYHTLVEYVWHCCDMWHTSHVQCRCVHRQQI